MVISENFIDNIHRSKLQDGIKVLNQNKNNKYNIYIYIYYNEPYNVLGILYTQ